MNVILTYFATATVTATDTECWKAGIWLAVHTPVLNFELRQYLQKIVTTTSGHCLPFWYPVEDGVAHCRSRLRIIRNTISAFEGQQYLLLGLYESYLYIRFPTAILDKHNATKMIVLQSAINEATFEMLYNALIVTKTQLSLLLC